VRPEPVPEPTPPPAQIVRRLTELVGPMPQLKPIELQVTPMFDQEKMSGIIQNANDVTEASLMFRAAATEKYTKEWLAAQEQLIRMQSEREIAGTEMTQAQIAQTRIAAESAIYDARVAYQDAFMQKWIEDNSIAASYLQALGKTYDDVVDMMISKEENRVRIFTALQNNFRRTFIGNAAAMMKAWISEQFKASLIGDALAKKSAATRKFDEAKIGAVKAYHAFAGIPIVGPALGAAAAAAAFAFLMAFHKGGYIGAMLQPQRGNERIINAEVGEYMVQRRAVDQVGRGTLDYINRTGQLPNASGVGGGVFAPQAHFHGGGDFVANAKDFWDNEVIPFIEEAMNDGRLRGTMRPRTA